MSWGGKRPGSGRKPKGDDRRVTLSVMVDPITKEKILAWREELGVSAGKFIDLLVEDYEEMTKR